MKKHIVCVLCVCVLGLALTGCKSREVSIDAWMKNQEALPTFAPKESMVQATKEPEATATPYIREELKETDSGKPEVTPEISAGAEETVGPETSENGENQGESTVFKGETYTFYKVEDALYMQNPDLARYKIRSVYEEAMFDNGFNGLFVGQVVTMFGDENVTGDYEALLSYIVAAEDASGEVIYLEVYFGPSGPAIGGSAGENYDKAAEELEKVIRSIEPMDYECECTYYDLIDIGGGTIMGTKDGKGYYRMEIDGVWY